MWYEFESPKEPRAVRRGDGDLEERMAKGALGDEDDDVELDDEDDELDDDDDLDDEEDEDLVDLDDEYDDPDVQKHHPSHHRFEE